MKAERGVGVPEEEINSKGDDADEMVAFALFSDGRGKKERACDGDADDEGNEDNVVELSSSSKSEIVGS